MALHPRPGLGFRAVPAPHRPQPERERLSVRPGLGRSHQYRRTPSSAATVSCVSLSWGRARSRRSSRPQPRSGGHFDACWPGRSRQWREGRRVRAGWVASLASTTRKRAASTLQRRVTFDSVAGWDYGDYEGPTTPEILARDHSWDMWRDGFPGGEDPGQMGARADPVLARLRSADGDVLAFCSRAPPPRARAQMAADGASGRRSPRTCAWDALVAGPRARDRSARRLELSPETSVRCQVHRAGAVNRGEPSGGTVARPLPPAFTVSR